jgi:hypothetical protein
MPGFEGMSEAKHPTTQLENTQDLKPLNTALRTHETWALWTPLSEHTRLELSEHRSQNTRDLNPLNTALRTHKTWALWTPLSEHTRLASPLNTALRTQSSTLRNTTRPLMVNFHDWKLKCILCINPVCLSYWAQYHYMIKTNLLV